MLLLRLVSQPAFDKVWSAMASAASKTWQLLTDLMAGLLDQLPEGISALAELGLAPRLVLGSLVLLVFVGGLVLGLRRR